MSCQRYNSAESRQLRSTRNTRHWSPANQYWYPLLRYTINPSHHFLPSSMREGLPSDWVWLNIFPFPTLNALHTVTPSAEYSKLFKVLTASHLTCGRMHSPDAASTRATRTPAIPPPDSMACSTSRAFWTSFPSLTCLRTWALMVAAFLSQAPFPPWGSLKSTRRTLIPVFSCIRLQLASIAELW